MSHNIIIRPTGIIEVVSMLAAIRGICKHPYELSGSDGVWKVAIDDEATCTKLELSLNLLVGLKVVSVDGVELI